MKTLSRLAVWPLLLACALNFLGGCSTAQQATAKNSPPRAIKVLIVYLSRTSNTKAVAQIIQQQVGGTLVALEMVKPYPADYQTTVAQVARENESGYLPPLKTKIARIADYDTVFVGFPTWGMQLPPPMKSFLCQSDLKGKTVVPFNTNAGYGAGRSFQAVRALCPNSTVLEGLETQGGIERDGQLLVIKGARAQQVRREVEMWLRKINRLP